ncbi:MAG: (E)-4-hydroxy-3-methylbut-2-enyl-diphosphate synthase [Bacteroidales bacterium]|nr:(E)-4-hydroxy-3-methylbut-2-enyl-diphosphate synthase [Bacteroidales bacterium]
MISRTVMIGGRLPLGGNNPIVVQTMCNTHTTDVEASLRQCRQMVACGAQMIRLTVPTLKDVEALASIRQQLRSEGIDTPLVADVHFSSEVAIAAAAVVEKVRINPGNFHKNHDMAVSSLSRLLEVCKQHGTAIRIGINHGSLGERITSLYGNTSEGMCKAAMEWMKLCIDNDFHDVVVSLKASNTLVMVDAYRKLVKEMESSGIDFPLHLGVTEAGNGDAGRIKSAVGISTLLSEGIGDTVRVSLTEDPVAELESATYLAQRYRGLRRSSLSSFTVENGHVNAVYSGYSSRDELLMDYACDWGRRLLDKEIDSVSIVDFPESDYFSDELLQACRRRFYRPEYVACPGCGRTMYDLQDAFEKVKAATSHLHGMVIAVMGCIVNGPGEMADADWGYVGEGGGKVTIYHKKDPVLKHIPQDEAVGKLLELIENEQ